MTVALGTLVYSFASTAFGGFGSGFSNLVQSAGQQLQENVVVEQVHFFNAENTSSNCAPAPPFLTVPATCGGVIYVRNTGANPVVIGTIYVGNITSGVPLTTDTTASCTSNTLAYGHTCFTTYDSVSHIFDTNALPMTAANPIMPGKVMAFYFVLPTDYLANPSCIPAQLFDCSVIHGGTVYAFTLVTSRGNEIVAYEKA